MNGELQITRCPHGRAVPPGAMNGLLQMTGPLAGLAVLASAVAGMRAAARVIPAAAAAVANRISLP